MRFVYLGEVVADLVIQEEIDRFLSVLPQRLGRLIRNPYSCVSLLILCRFIKICGIFYCLRADFWKCLCFVLV